MIPLNNQNNNTNLIDDYTNSIIAELSRYASAFDDKEVKTIHFGWWSPQTLWLDNIMKIIDFIKANFNLEYMEELWIELNPVPNDQVLDLIVNLNKNYTDFYRIRYSIWIQSFDDDILQKSWRNYNFNSLLLFLRQLPSTKQLNNVFNFDFIAFGKFKLDKKWNKVLRDDKKLSFFQDFISSWFVDSISLYTLELFPWSPWYSIIDNNNWLFGSDEDIFEEFGFLKSLVLDSNMKRYEISNFSTVWKQSLHNKIYWNMENYIGIGLSSSSFLWNKDEKLDKNYNLQLLWLELPKGSCWIRFKNTSSVKNYLKGDFIDKKSVQNLTQQDYLIEKFMLSLRTQEWVWDIQEFVSVLVPDYQELIKEYEENGLLVKIDKWFVLTDNWMDLFNQIVTQLLKVI